MKTRSEYLELLNTHITDLKEQFGVRSFRLFGSVARNEHTEESDVDVCVDLENPSLFNLVHIKEELQQLFGKTVDIIRIRPEMDALMKRDIMMEGLYV